VLDLPAHCIYHLLRSHTFTKHQVSVRPASTLHLSLTA